VPTSKTTRLGRFSYNRIDNPNGAARIVL
jgi:hypothetical protein